MSPWVQRALANNLPVKVYTPAMNTNDPSLHMTVTQLRAVLEPRGWRVDRFQFDCGETVTAAPPEGRPISRSGDWDDRAPSAARQVYDVVVGFGLIH